MTQKDSNGSIWRIWDLHVHTPATYGGEYKNFIENAKNSIADVIGINDYCTLKGYEEIIRLGGIPGKTIFPVVEFRMHNIVANKKNPDPTKGGAKVNFHIIFDNNPKIYDKISNWLNSLECFDEQGKDIQLGVATDLMKITFDFENTLKSLKKLGLHKEHALVWLPYDEYGGIDEIDPNDNFFKLSLINKAHIMGSSRSKQIDFFKWKDPKFSTEDYKQWFDKPKPCIKGSDAHELNYPLGKLKNQKSQPIDKHCWIKADATFAGLKQTLVEPDRVFIGDEPDLIKRVKNNPTKFIKTLSISKQEGAEIDDVWFNDFEIELNSSLVAIIGNKGGGKSAITDIISLCANTHQDPSNFSFLTSNKFRKSKPYNLSNKFEANIQWHDETDQFKKLDENPDLTEPERVKYIPQNFLERLCTNVESEDFEKELKKIIFSHTPIDQRLGKTSLDELINYKSNLITSEIEQIQSQLSSINRDIVSLESKSTDSYKNKVSNDLKLKKGELDAHNANKPIKPAETKESEESAL